MKTLTLSLITTALLFTYTPTLCVAQGADNSQKLSLLEPVHTESNPAMEATDAYVLTGSQTQAATQAREASQAKDLLFRLEQIKDMDKSNMTRAEKKELRKETRAIRDQLSTLGGGVYITAGGIIIILLLLILLF